MPASPGRSPATPWPFLIALRRPGCGHCSGSARLHGHSLWQGRSDSCSSKSDPESPGRTCSTRSGRLNKSKRTEAGPSRLQGTQMLSGPPTAPTRTLNATPERRPSFSWRQRRTTRLERSLAPPLWMKRECWHCRNSIEPSAILHPIPPVRTLMRIRLPHVFRSVDRATSAHLG